MTPRNDAGLALRASITQCRAAQILQHKAILTATPFSRSVSSFARDSDFSARLTLNL